MRKSVFLIGIILALLAGVGCTNTKEKKDEIEQFKRVDIDIDAIKASARTAAEYGHETEAFIHYTQVLELEPNDREANLGIAQLYLDNEDPDDAIKHFNRILANQGEDIDALEGRASAYLKLRDFVQAKAEYTTVINMNESRWKSWQGLGIIADIMGEYDKARDAYETALLYESDDAGLLNNYGYSRIMAHQYKDAEKLLRRAVVNDSSSSMIRNNLAIAIAWQGRYTDASYILTDEKESPEAYNNVGYIAYLAGDYEQAIEYFEKALSISPTYYTIAARNLERALRKLSPDLRK